MSAEIIIIWCILVPLGFLVVLWAQRRSHAVDKELAAELRRNTFLKDERLADFIEDVLPTLDFSRLSKDRLDTVIRRMHSHLAFMGDIGLPMSGLMLRVAYRAACDARAKMDPPKP